MGGGRRSLIYLADADLCNISAPITIHLSIQRALKETSALTETLAPQFLPQILSFFFEPKW